MKRNTMQLLGLLLFLASCQSEFSPLAPQEAAPSTEYFNVEAALISYYDRFADEAQKRNVSIDLSDVSGEIASISESGVAGTCQYGSHITNHITIDQQFWNNASSTYREFVVFHELGHCVLGLGHNEDSDSQGRCLSIMRSGLTDCWDSYSANTRNYFLNELFGVGD